MTLGETVRRFDLLYPNAMELPLKTDLISFLEGRLNREILALYGEDEPAFTGYSAAADADRTLLIPFPFDDIYLKFLAAENDLVNGDTARYLNSAAVFNSAWDMLAAYYNRTRIRPNETHLKLN